MKWLKRLLIVLFIIVVVLIIFFWGGGSTPKLLEVKIKAPPGTKIFATLPGGDEVYLKDISRADNAPITAEVPTDATTVILRYDSQEKVFHHWKGGITHDFFPKFGSVTVNADPDAEIFIIRPETDEEEFIDTVPATVPVPIGATVILKYKDKKRAFHYKQGRKEIYHNFLP